MDMSILRATKRRNNISRGLVLAKEKRELYVNTCKSNEEKKEKNHGER